VVPEDEFDDDIDDAGEPESTGTEITDRPDQNRLN
jgi:hypothetical protein